jgi:2-polyprenyl-3-methyl-5-hydroxy-6-metoxy-1,4-benzoquinol methylase
MATDYELSYRENPHGLGEPPKAFVASLDAYDKTHASVLDVGYGQGRGALFVARLGHSVMAVDQSQTGIRQLESDAKKEAFVVNAKVGDITDFAWVGPFDVVIVDRTLHKLALVDRV